MSDDARTEERLQKIMARSGLGSRRLMESWIEEGRVTVNGQTARLGDRADLERDAVKVDGRRLAAPNTIHKYILLNKPANYVSTMHDPEDRRTIVDLIPQRLRSGLVPVGRLDFDSEGLILLTDDGHLANRVAHPRYGCTKAYEVKVKGRPGEDALNRLREGMMLYGKPTAPITVVPHRTPSQGRESQSNSWWRVVLGEGRTRQIREMFFRVGHPVGRLRRVAIGQLRDPYLALGTWRMLTEAEVEELRQRTAKAVPRPKLNRRPRRPRASDRAAGSAPRPAMRHSGGDAEQPSRDRSQPVGRPRDDRDSKAGPRRGPGSRDGAPSSRPSGRSSAGGGASGRGAGPAGRGPSSRGPSSHDPSSGGPSGRGSSGRGASGRGPSGGKSPGRGGGSAGSGRRGPGGPSSRGSGPSGRGGRGPSGRGGGGPGRGGSGRGGKR